MYVFTLKDGRPKKWSSLPVTQKQLPVLQIVCTGLALHSFSYSSYVKCIWKGMLISLLWSSRGILLIILVPLVPNLTICRTMVPLLKSLHGAVLNRVKAQVWFSSKFHFVSLWGIPQASGKGKLLDGQYLLRCIIIHFWVNHVPWQVIKHV